MPKISVIIPVFNHRDELLACLRSLDDQTEKDLEIIIVDDGSEIPVEIPPEAKGIGRDISLIRFETNRGAPAARNAGFTKSTGDYVIFLDADAELIPEALQRMREALDLRTEIDFVYPSFRFGFKTFLGRHFDVESLKKANYIHTSALMRREAFPRFDESLKKFQDWDIFLTMAEQGKKGFWIKQVLFSIKPRKTGMSRWMPSFAYTIPWKKLGWIPQTIKKYQQAEAIIREKHQLPPKEVPKAPSPLKSAFKTFLPPILFVAIIEFLSIPAAWSPGMNSGFVLMIGAWMLAFSFRRPTSAFGFLLLEFLIGSKGRLLAYEPDINNDGGLSLRMVLVATFFLGWLLRRGSAATWKIPVPILSLMGLVAYAMWMGIALYQPFILSDANAWGVLLLIFPIIDLIQYDTVFWSTIKRMAMIGIAWIALKSIVLFYLFSHAFDPLFLEVVYRWVRRTGVGEITAIGDGGVARIFIQSQIYALLGAVYLAYKAANKTVSRNYWAAMAICILTTLISFSRSFWIALGLGFSFCAIVVLRRKTWSWFKGLLLSIAAAIFSLVGIAQFAFPMSTAGNPIDWLAARADIGEAAATSRWELLPILFQKVMESPVAGHGFGATVTYQSADPRVIERTGGMYTTYAFEWGWMDLWIKFGILGPIVMLWLLASLSRARPDLAPVILALATVHVFTPYLNHPLGLMVVLLIAGAVNVSREPEQARAMTSNF